MANYGLLDMPNTDPWRGVLSDPRSAYRTQYAEPQPQQIVTPDSRAGRTPESYGLLSNQAPKPAPWEISSGLAESLSPMVAGYGAGQMTSYAKDAAQSGDYGTATGAGLMAAMSMMPMKKGAASVAAAERPTGIRAYHGSPHDFDKFDISKIGTGEGVQAYGHGLYFAEQEAVAKGYRDRLGVPAGTSTAEIVLNKHNGDYQKAIEDIKSWPGMEGNGMIADAISQLENKAIKSTPTGRMYEVNIKADPEHFLDWDKPLSQQSEAVRKAMEGRFGADLSKEYANYKPIDLREIEQVSADMGAKSDVPVPSPHSPEGVQALREAGIPGIRYLDQGSRGAGEGSRNYVVFDPATIEIMRKYGLIGPMAGGVAAGAATQQPRSLIDQ